MRGRLPLPDTSLSCSPNLDTMNKAVEMDAYPAPPAEDFDALDNLDFREILGAIISGWPIILLALIVGYLAGQFWAYSTPSTYKTDALLQVEGNSNQARIALAQTAEFVEQRTALPAEIEILKSRMVLGTVARDLGLDIIVTPSFLPWVGEPIWRNHSGPDFGKAPGWLSPLVRTRHAWGGESMTVSRFDVPTDLENVGFVIASEGGGRFYFLSPSLQKLAEGKVGELLAVEHPAGNVQLFVQQLNSPPGRLFYIRKQPLQTAAATIEARLNASPKGGDGWRAGASILQIAYQSQDPREATRTLKKILDVFQQQNVERRSAEAQQTLDFLEQQLPELREQVETAESRLNSFKVNQGTADLTAETSIVLERAVELDQQRNALIQQREEALRRYTDNHPVVASINDQIQRLDSQRARIDRRVQELPDAQQRALGLTRDVEVLTALYVSLLNRAQELEVVKSGTIGNVRIIDPPVRPLGPSGPNRARLVGLPVTASLMLAVGLILLRYFLHNGVKDPATLEKRLGLATFGIIPYSPAQKKLLDRVKQGESQQALLAATDPHSPTMEAIRSARTALFFAQMEAKNNAVMITGPVPGVGKSFVSANLAAALAMAGKSVVLIDADMRRGTLHEIFGVERGIGLSEVISKQTNSKSVIRTTNVDNLHLLTSGTIPPNPAEILVNQRFAALLNHLESVYDFVILDTPPVLAVTDASIIGRMVGSSFLVLQSGEHSIRMIEDSIKRVSASGARVTGTIFNQVGYGYGYGYGYGAKYGEYSYEYKPQT